MPEYSLTSSQARPNPLRALAGRLRVMLQDSRVLRGGRMLKWKGEVATCAPMMAQLVWCARMVRAAVLPAIVAGLAVNQAGAADKYWDGGTVNGGNPVANANGGTGTWNNTLTNWDTAATGGSSVSWASGDNAFFSAAPTNSSIVTLGEPITAHNLTFQVNGYTLTGNTTITLIGPTPQIAVNGGDGAIINSTLAGIEGFTLTDGGTLTLGGTNTLTGGITVEAGVLRLGGINSANGANNVVLVKDNGALVVNTSTAFGGDTAASRLLLEDGALMTVNGITLNHDVTAATGGTITIRGGTWGGTVVLNSATTVRFEAITATGNLSNSNGHVLSIDTVSLGGTVTFSGNLSHTGGLTVGNNTILSGINTYSGNTIVAGHSSGTSMLTYTQAAAISANSNVVIGSASTVGLVAFGYNPAAITLGTGVGQFQFQGDGGFLARNSSASDVTLTINGGASLTWGVTPSFIADGNTLYLGANATDTTARELNLTNDIDLGSQQRTIFANKGTSADHGVMSGVLSGSGGLLIAGDGILELRGTNTYTGATQVQSALILGTATTINQSNLQLDGIGGNYQDDGLIVLTAGTGDFVKSLGTGANQVQWLADGGFAAFGADRTVNIGNGTALIWGQGGFVGDGDRLVFGGTYGNAAVNFQNAIDLGSQNRTIEVNNIAGSGRAVNLNGVISGSGALILDGNGEVALTGLNTFTGNAVLGTTSRSNLQVYVTNIGNMGVPGNLGAGSTIELKSAAGNLAYTGAGESTNRNWIVGLSNGASFGLNNDGSGALQLAGNITKDATGAANTLVLQGSFASTDTNGIADDPNLISGVISESSGTLAVQINSGTWRLTGDNTYGGRTFINGGILEVDHLANGGMASSIGNSSNAASNLAFTNNGTSTLRYVGTGDSTDRLMEIQTGSRLESSGTGALHFTNPGLLAPRTGTGPGSYRLVLGGTNEDENTFALTLTNMVPALDHSSQNFGLTKDGSGLWALTTNNNANANAYTNNTIITAGALKLNNAGAITGGLGTASNHGAAGSVERSSLIQFNSAVSTGGVLGLTAASGSFTRGVTTATQAFVDNGGTVGMQDDDNFIQGVNWSGSGGFAAWDGTQIVNLGGASAQVTWATGGFVPTNRSLVFGYITANGTVDFQNGVNLTNAARTIEVNNGTAAVDAIMSGVIASTTTAGALVKNGAGTLALTAANTYTGTTTINAGTLQIGNNTATGTLGTGNVTVAAGANLAFDRNNAYTVANLISGGGTVTQQGTGTTTLTGANGYSGGTFLNAGILSVSSNGNLGAPAGPLTFNGGVLQVTGTSFNSLSRTIDWQAGGGGFDIASAANTLTVTSSIVGTGPLEKRGAGTLVFTADNAVGNTTISAGTLQLGSGGTTGWLTTSLLTNNGTLAFNRSDNATFGGLISGTGAVNQIGGGVTTLTGNNTYAGATNVNAGTLLINGNQSGATGPTTVASGATLGGTGTIGGSVTVANGGHLSPGGPGNASGALTIQQTLGLSSGSLLDFNFGQANAPGNPANDLVNVGGGVTLDGTLNVSLSPSGTFAPGLYRVMNYSGGLNNQGLDIGSVPPGVNAANLFVQTSVPGQVNLINTAGLTLQYWDGAAGPKNDGIIQGGHGVWQANAPTANDNWTIVDGTPNAPFSDGAFAIFGGTAGTVNVDSVTFGQVRAAGMQFTADGYLIQGDPIQLDDPNAVGGSAVIRVDPGMTAIIASQLTGDVELIKFDSGTLILSGNNSYTGGTRIESGTLQVSSNANLGDFAGALTFAGGTLHTTASFQTGRNVNMLTTGTILTDAATALTLSGNLSGAGSLTKDGAGDLIIIGNAAYTGGTTITAGTLQIGNGNTTGTITGPIVNNSVLAFNRAGVITVPGEISGSGAVNQIGPGTTIFTGDNTYTGLTTISAGTLQLGDGGTTGSVVGDIVNNSVLTFNRAGTLSMPGLISGTGVVNQNGPGVTILSNNNSYTGTTTVTAGTLLVNGNQSAATGPTFVNGGTLGGSGTIGGSVTVANGGHIAPGGAPGNVVGNLTIQQNLSLSSGSVLDFNFGLANSPGGPLNDLLTVGGNLTLAGTLNVSVSPGGTFLPGFYRVIDYSGTLTNNGLALGSFPPGSELSVQTSIAGQVNLVNEAGVTLNYWDGAAGPKNNGVVNGGDGIWQANQPGANDNWTTSVGTPNAAFANGSFAIFAGSAGTVTVDNSRGQVTVSGMQFGTSGYVIQGEPILLAGSPVIIRVGDGSLASPSYIATIAAELTGAAELVKMDPGTLILSGINSYTGGTTIREGTVQVSADNNLGAAAGAVTLDGGTLRTTADFTVARTFNLLSTGTIFTDPGTTLSVSGTMSGAGSLTKDGGGDLVLLTAAIYTGSTTVAEGTLRAGAANVFSAASAHSVLAGATLDLNGFDQTLSALTNAGLVRLGGAPGTTLNVGAYTGNGGTLHVNTVLGGDASPTDRLVATTTAGSSTLRVTNVGGAGGATTNGIKVIDVTNPGASTGTFTLQGDYAFHGQQAVVGGAYAYTLQQNGVSSTDGDWYLRSSLINPPPELPPGPLLQPGVPLYETYGQVLLGLMRMPTMRQRVGERYWDGEDAMAVERAARSSAFANDIPPGEAFAAFAVPGSLRGFDGGGQHLMWGRIEGRHGKFNPTTTTGSRYNSNQVVMESGLDGLLVDNAHGRLFAGVSGQYGHVSASVRSVWGNGSIIADGYSFGGTLTWVGLSGFYVDSQAQVTWFDSKLTSNIVSGSVAKGDDAFGHSFSAEAGQRLALGYGWSVTPQVQLSYMSVSASFVDRFGAAVSLDDAESLQSRLGFSLDHRKTWRDASGQLTRSSVYGIANLYYEFLGGTVVNVAGTTFANANERLWGGVGLGGTYNWADDKYALFGEVTVNTSLKDFGDSHSVNGTTGFRVRW
jgi:fibronectin-binding autotransporter adhesin